jgi:hypothetical protein
MVATHKHHESKESELVSPVGKREGDKDEGKVKDLKTRMSPPHNKQQQQQQHLYLYGLRLSIPRSASSPKQLFNFGQVSEGDMKHYVLYAETERARLMWHQKIKATIAEQKKRELASRESRMSMSFEASDERQCLYSKCNENANDDKNDDKNENENDDDNDNDENHDKGDSTSIG